MAEKRVRLSDQLRRAVDASGLSHYAICKVTGIDKGSFSRFMAGKGWLSVEKADALGDLLRLEIVRRGKPPVIPKAKPGRKKKAR